MALGQEFDQNVLDMVRILILINQDVAPAPLVLFQDIGVLLEELHGVSQQIVEVEGPVGQELFLITGIHRRDGLGPEAIGLLPVLFGADEFVLGAADGLEDEPWLIALLVQVQFRQALPDYSQLIRRIVNEKIAREPQLLSFPAEDPNANRVEGPDPKILHIPHQFLHPPLHFGRGFVGEGNGQDLPGSSARRQQIADPVGEDSGLAAPRPRQD